MRVGDTIIARSSPPGRSARALIRLSGPSAHAALDALAPACAIQPGSEAFNAGTATRPVPVAARLTLPSDRTLAVLTTRFAAPRSATGEAMAELLLPGNPALVERAIDALIGAAPDRIRRAEPGEFTARAFMNGRIDLVRAEGVARLIAARTEDERQAAVRLASGASGDRYARWTDRVAALLALTEAGIDFTDQDDVVPLAPAELSRLVRTLLAELDEATRSAAPSEHREHRPRVVLVGPANAGKSTLFNALLGRERAVVSAIAGSTRDVLVEPLDLSSDVPGADWVDLCDLAGLSGHTGEPTAETAVNSHAAAEAAARRAIESADLLLVCEPRGRFEHALAAFTVPPGTPVLLVRTKADLPGQIDHPASGTAESAVAAAVAVCALDRWRLPALRRAIADLVASRSTGAASDILPRHRAAIAEAHRALRDALPHIPENVQSLAAPELVAARLREALDALGQITGRTAPDDILGRIFATFCVGK